MGSVRAALAIVLLCIAHVLAAASATGNRVLAIVDNVSEYSAWTAHVRQQGYDVVLLHEHEAGALDLNLFGKRTFDHIAMLAPHTKQSQGALSPQALVAFLENGGNLVVALNANRTEQWRDFAREFGVEFGERRAMLIDHFSYDANLDSGDHTAVRVGGIREHFAPGGPVPNRGVFGFDTLELLALHPMVYRGVAHRVGPNPLLFSVLAPPGASYEGDVPSLERTSEGYRAQNLDKLEPLYGDKQLLTGFDAASDSAPAALASATQLLGNAARVVFVGSTELFKNTLYSDAALSNRAVLNDLVSWAFQERGVLRVLGTSHERIRKNEHDVRPEYDEVPGIKARVYRIKDEVHYTLDVAEYVHGAWAPTVDDLDLQLSVTMLDPHLTLPLVAEKTAHFTRYATKLRLPDRHGVFTLRVDWKRHGWTYILAEDTVPVRPFNHDEYPRMLSSSWPYIAGAMSTMLAFTVFTFLWLTMPSPKSKQE
ncbi:oligosaccharyl transferase glycoprotein complex, beta subunit [Malassezia vespertilionis]|uniref:Dolichyl-diphosphooligosaccharide--protein glycosyltransferase subunit WBP1 n=1 Tax=Malassezia vespertilionis TaxID=2020962 RepID=A0A2N1JBP6_9BASI|nr:oligosaccharyl transferase glycoprotein complex, beta subunit [Malassezia vespertilionis]PKI83965.1 Wbp1p [Malassezia vespertilionis]WFD06615.1 oligosaccharyl transferase glycoprotein complex, beta subunit [Malassezia vespertilionis]